MSRAHGNCNREFVIAIVVLLAAITCSPRAAWAHAVLRSSTPAAGSAIPAGEVALTLKYNSRVDPLRSSLSLLGPDGKVIPLVIGPQQAAEVLSSKIGLSAEGKYLLRWQALSGDGHITRGEIPFSVR
jgi:copper resistance protein C